MKAKINNKWYSITRGVSVYWVLIIVLTAALPYNLYLNNYKLPIAHNEEVAEDRLLPYKLIHETNSNKLTHPLRLITGLTEDQRFMPLKDRMNTYINDKMGHELKMASVYFNALNDANGGFSVNGNEKFNPASMMKVSFIIAMLKEAENNPEILDKKVYYGKHNPANGDQLFLDHKLPEGKSYTIRELLYYAAVYSDNDAAFLVVNNFKWEGLTTLASSLDLPEPKMRIEYYLTAEEMSRFFRVLFNASYLSNDMSEYALDLLSKSDYKEGLVKKLDNNVLVARKFGERGIEDYKELHEFGIVYIKNQPYLIGIMTRGNDYKQLQEVISDLSLMAYDEMMKPL